MAHALVFFYGTLRTGLCNHRYVRHMEFVGPARTAQPLALFADHLPYLLGREATRAHLAQSSFARGLPPATGEVYAAQARDMAFLDDFEDHPYTYRREQIEVVLTQASEHHREGERLQAWCYLYPHPRGRLVPTGDYARWLVAVDDASACPRPAKADADAKPNTGSGRG